MKKLIIVIVMVCVSVPLLAENVLDYFPLKEGYAWEYDDGNGFTWEIRCGKMAYSPILKKNTVEFISGGKPELLAYDNTTVYSVDAQKNEITGVIITLENTEWEFIKNEGTVKVWAEKKSENSENYIEVTTTVGSFTAKTYYFKGVGLVYMLFRIDDEDHFVPLVSKNF